MIASRSSLARLAARSGGEAPTQRIDVRPGPDRAGLEPAAPAFPEGRVRPAPGPPTSELPNRWMKAAHAARSGRRAQGRAASLPPPQPGLHRRSPGLPARLAVHPPAALRFLFTPAAG